ncbi:MAG TPA: tandem-95 repeat protein, partial [Verrucomicrobiae bacterium]|nr:tandem-95 repeat protein [Verrucomicrobiae bacterium]
MSARSGRLWRARCLWGLSLGLVLSGGVMVHALTPSDLAGSTLNASVHVGRPVAHAGDNFNAATGTPTTLDGSASFDQDARLLTFRWRLQHAPRGSAATLVDSTQPNPTFTPDVPGRYKFELVVTNGSRDSSPAYVKMTAFASGTAPPNARPGRDQSGFVGTPVALDGGESDDPEDALLLFVWSFRRVPPHSSLTSADIVGRDTAMPSFIPDVRGEYRLLFQVSDGVLTDEAIVLVVADSLVGPHADAGPDQLVEGLGPITLDGRDSNDSDGRPSPVSYSWRLVARPPGSALTTDALQHATTVTPTFTPDVLGAYIFRLQVSDGSSTDEDNVLIEVASQVNHPPIAQDDAAVTDENAPVGITVLGNDMDPDSDPLTITDVTQGANGGTVAINGVTATYTPPANWSGTDSFTYSISDGRGGTDTGSVTVTVNLVNDPPTVTLGAEQTSGPLPLVVAFTAATSDSDGDLLTYAWDFGDGTTKPTGSAIESHTYQTAGSFTATVTVSDGQATAQASLDITPSGVPDPSTVAPPLSQTVTTDLGSGTAFLYSGSNPIQTGVAPGTINLTRAAVLRGRVLNSLGTPLPGVAIGILNHPELGQTQS